MTFLEEILPHRPHLHRLARRLGDPDDLVQETYLRAIQSRGSYRPGSDARAWLICILRNAAYTEGRRRARERRMRERWPLTRATPAPRGEEARQALSRLRPPERQLLWLAEVEGMHYRELATTLACPIGTVMSRLYRARRRLRAAADGITDRDRRGTRRTAAPSPARCRAHR